VGQYMANLFEVQGYAAHLCTEYRDFLNKGVNLDRDINCDDMVDEILMKLKNLGFSWLEADLFFSFAKARLQNSLLEQRFCIPSKYPS